MALLKPPVPLKVGMSDSEAVLLSGISSVIKARVEFVLTPTLINLEALLSIVIAESERYKVLKVYVGPIYPQHKLDSLPARKLLVFLKCDPAGAYGEIWRCGSGGKGLPQ